MKRYPLVVKLLFSLFCGLLTYAILECTYSVLYVQGIVGKRPSFWAYEDSGKTIRFDPIRGYRLTETPSRFARISYGRIEYKGIVRGNNQGFADRDDFWPRRDDEKTIRIGVFGDSFSTGWELDTNWPDAVEDLARQSDKPLELLNFSIDGGGLMNWWSILIRLVQADQYELDALIFAVYERDLHRGFAISEHRGFRNHMWASLEIWDPQQWPTNEGDALLELYPITDAFILAPDSYADALAGKWHPDRITPRPWRPYLADTMVELAWRLTDQFSQRNPNDPSLADQQDQFQPGQMELIEDVIQYKDARSLPVLVVRVPSKEGLIQNAAPRATTVQFASLLQARFVDGHQAFSGFDEKDIHEHWHPYDGHWSQRGADRFAAFMHDILTTWDRLKSDDRPTENQLPASKLPSE